MIFELLLITLVITLLLLLPNWDWKQENNDGTNLSGTQQDYAYLQNVSGDLQNVWTVKKASTGTPAGNCSQWTSGNYCYSTTSGVWKCDATYSCDKTGKVTCKNPNVPGGCCGFAETDNIIISKGDSVRSRLIPQVGLGPIAGQSLPATCSYSGGPPITPTPECGTNGSWVKNKDYGGEGGYCLCNGGWTNVGKGRGGKCDKKIMCAKNSWCQKGCARTGASCSNWASWQCAGCDWCSRTKACGSTTGLTRTGGKGCCGDGCSGRSAFGNPGCFDPNTDRNAIFKSKPSSSNSYPCWCSSGNDKDGTATLMTSSGVTVPDNTKLPSICDVERGDYCLNCADIRGYNGWNNDGSGPPFVPTGLSGAHDDGATCQGQTCRVPGSATKNGVGCGWKIK
jgi:hypothetical protein